MPALRLTATASIVMAIVLAAHAWPLVATAQDSGPGVLWEAFPLGPEVTAPATPAAPERADAPAASTDSSDGLVMTLAIAAALVALAATAAVALMARRRGRPGVPDAPAARPSPPRAAEPPAPAPARPTRARDGALDLARLAADYLEVVAAGSRRPVVDLAERRSWDPERTRRALGRARSRGLLVGPGRGRVGGALSDEAERLLRGPAAVTRPVGRRRSRGSRAAGPPGGASAPRRGPTAASGRP